MESHVRTAKRRCERPARLAPRAGPGSAFDHGALAALWFGGRGVAGDRRTTPGSTPYRRQNRPWAQTIDAARRCGCGAGAHGENERSTPRARPGRVSEVT